jgi:hypothetical protein
MRAKFLLLLGAKAEEEEERFFFLGKVDLSWKIEFQSRAQVELSFQENWKGLRLKGSLS